VVLFSLPYPHTPESIEGLREELHGASKAAEALNNSLNKILPIMPNGPDGCRLLPTYPIDSVESSE